MSFADPYRAVKYTGTGFFSRQIIALTLSDTTAKKQLKVMPIAMDIVHRNRL
jgi:hypothetical protein